MPTTRAPRTTAHHGNSHRLADCGLLGGGNGALHTAPGIHDCDPSGAEPLPSGALGGGKWIDGSVIAVALPVEPSSSPRVTHTSSTAWAAAHRRDGKLSRSWASALCLSLGSVQGMVAIVTSMRDGLSETSHIVWSCIDGGQITNDAVSVS
jgi:hypothetical protein